MAINLQLLQTSSDNRALYKSWSGLKAVTCTIKEPCELSNPVFIVAFDNSAFNANYCYCANFGRYYYINERVLITGGRIELHCHVDVLQTYNTNIAALTVTVTRQQHKGINHVPDSLLPLSPAKQTYVAALGGNVFNLTGANSLSFNFVLNVAGGAGGTPDSGGTGGTPDSGGNTGTGGNTNGT